MMNWAIVSAVLVGVHLISEYVHYTLEFLWGRKDKKVLEDILCHRKVSRKSEMLAEIITDLRMIKSTLKIEDMESRAYELGNEVHNCRFRRGFVCLHADFRGYDCLGPLCLSKFGSSEEKERYNPHSEIYWRLDKGCSKNYRQQKKGEEKDED
jgi:hypothetical protein